jgi:hypothetical protein
MWIDPKIDKPSGLLAESRAGAFPGRRLGLDGIPEKEQVNAFGPQGCGYGMGR